MLDCWYSPGASASASNLKLAIVFRVEGQNYHPIKTICTSMNNDAPSYELVVSIDVPEIVGKGNDVDSPIDCVVIPKLLTQAIYTTKGLANSVSLYTKTKAA